MTQPSRMTIKAPARTQTARAGFVSHADLDHDLYEGSDAAPVMAYTTVLDPEGERWLLGRLEPQRGAEFTTGSMSLQAGVEALAKAGFQRTRAKDTVRVAQLSRQAGQGAASGVRAEAYRPDARAEAVLRGVRTVEMDLAAAGGAYDLEQVRSLLRGISRQAVDKRVQDGSLLAVPGPSGRRFYPTVQFNGDGSIVGGLKRVQQALPSQNGWSVLHFLIRPHASLDGRHPIDLLKAGEVDLVVEAARRLDQQGA